MAGGALGSPSLACCNHVRVHPSASAGHDDVLRALMRVSRAFLGLTACSLADIGVDVTLPQFRVLAVLAVRGPMRSVDIAEELGVNPSTGTRMCDRLVRKTLIRRVRSTSDRRVVRLRLTQLGHDIVDRVMTRRREDLERLVGATADCWQPAVIDALTAFAEAAGEPDERACRRMGRRWARLDLPIPEKDSTPTMLHSVASSGFAVTGVGLGVLAGSLGDESSSAIRSPMPAPASGRASGCRIRRRCATVVVETR